jgi:hypothetical protein
MTNTLLTCFASAERSSQSEILRQYQVIANNKDLVILLNSVSSMLSVLNMNRQIVFANKMILEVAGVYDVHEALGKRVGELFGCRHAFEVNGCGTSLHCSTCKAVRTMLACVKSTESMEECSLTNHQMETIDLRVHSTYTKVYGEEFIICSLLDISDEKRRGIMERIFFHDIMNTIHGISGIAHVLPMIDVDKQPTYLSYLSRLMQSLVDEIQSHRVLTMAEKNEYRVAKNKMSSLDFVREEVEKYQQIVSLEAKEVRITGNSENHDFVSDKILLSRVLGNMIKNALEAEQDGAIVDIGIHKSADEYLCFRVHNNSIISESDKMKVFTRSFSTKGPNRGLGTYSMKLLTEKYLKGTIDFSSNPDEGTVFTVKIPLC